MKILIVNSILPFTHDATEEVALNLQENLLVAGHEAEILRIPFKSGAASAILSQIMMVRAFEFANVDHIIALKFPAHLVRHPKKTIWLLEAFYPIYGIYPTVCSDINECNTSRLIYDLARNSDLQSLQESYKVFTGSLASQKQLLLSNQVPASILLPPHENDKLLWSKIIKRLL